MYSGDEYALSDVWNGEYSGFDCEDCELYDQEDENALFVGNTVFVKCQKCGSQIEKNI